MVDPNAKPDDDRTIFAGTHAPPAKSQSERPPGSSPQPAADSEDPADNTLPAGTRLNEFEIVGLVGMGGFAIVYLAHDHSLGRRIALKEYMPFSLAARGLGAQVTMKSPRHAETFEAGRRSFVNEARLLARFDHPALVKVYRFWEANGTAYMVMPYYEGKTLKHTLQQMDGRPDEAWLRHLLAPLLDALEVLHTANIFHRDIAPDNIMLLPGERPLLLDFGAARHVISDMTQALTVILKPGYAPVEQYAAMPDLEQGAWTDIYALTAVVHLAIVGQTPPPSVGRMMNDSMRPLAQQLAGRYSDAFLRAIDRGLAVKPQDRPQSVAEFRELLGLDHASPLSAPAAPVARTAPTHADSVMAHAARSKVPLLASVVGVATLAGLVAGGYYLLKEPASAPPPLTAQVPATMVPKPAPPAAPVPEVPVPDREAPPASAAAPAIPPAPAFPAPPASPSVPPAATLTVPPAVTLAVPPAATLPVPPAAPAATLAAPPAATLAVPPATTLAVPPAPFSPVDEIDRILRERDRDHLVTVALDKSRVRIGSDQLSFHVRSSRPGYLYVLMVGTDRQHFYRLFPNAIDDRNRIEPSESVSLPRSGWLMVAGGPPGANQFVTVVSEHPRDFADAGMVVVDPFAEFPLDTAAAIAATHPEGQSPFLGKPICPGGGTSCSSAYGAAAFTIVETE